jgi:hypothetical protein
VINRAGGDRLLPATQWILLGPGNVYIVGGRTKAGTLVLTGVCHENKTGQAEKEKANGFL